MHVGGTYENYQMATLDKKEEYYSGYLTGIRMNYQYNQALSFRLLGQYNDFSQTFQLQPLVSSPARLRSFIEGLVQDRQLFLKFQYLFN
jgi:hypothetical protein